MTLRELDPQFLKVITPTEWKIIHGIKRAHGVQFLCPKCYAANGGPRGTHSIICWSPRVAQNVTPTPGRWEMHGSGFDDLTLVAGSSSVALYQEWTDRDVLNGGRHAPAPIREPVLRPLPPNHPA